VDWVKLAIRYYADPKVAALPDEATELMFVRGLCRAGEERSAGFIPESALPELARRRRYAACASALVAAGLWSRVDGGYQVTRWADWQDGLDVLTRRRAADRERQRRRRAAVHEERLTGARAVSSPPEGQTWRSESEVSGSPDNQTAPSRDNGRLSRDVDQVSRDMSRDVTAADKEKDKELPRGRSSSNGGDPLVEPPRQCVDHESDPDPPPCGACANARRHHERWQAEKRRRLDAAPKCRWHRGQLAANCAPCRSERLERE
jgi:hypothetical protein